jgi:hypothetical protein
MGVNASVTDTDRSVEDDGTLLAARKARKALDTNFMLHLLVFVHIQPPTKGLVLDC